MPEPSELLLILEERDAEASEKRWRVTQRISQRVLLIDPGPTTKEELRTIRGVRAVLAPGEWPPDEVRRELGASEALFVEAFAQRARHKERPGDGLRWDAEGFLPPDPPKRR